MTDFKIGDIVKFIIDDIECYGKVIDVTPKRITVYDLDDYDDYTLNKEKAILVEPIYLDKDTYQKFARYEITLQDIIEDNVPENIINKDNYVITLEDIYCALNKFCNEIIDIR